MARPARYRKIQYPPLTRGLRPIANEINESETLILLLEEYEAIRLMDYEYLNQEEAAKRMNVSRPTLSRIYDSARKKLAKALVQSVRIEVFGGNVEFEHDWFRCDKCHTVFQVHDIEGKLECPQCKSKNLLHINDEVKKHPKRRRNYYQRHAMSSSGFCVCPQCGKRVSHRHGNPCRNVICTDCSISMQREGKDCE